MTYIPISYVLRISIFIFAVLSIAVFSSCGGGSERKTIKNIPDLRLSSIRVLGYDIDFEKTKTGVYTVVVDNDVDTATIEIEPGSEQAIISGYLVESDNRSHSFKYDGRKKIVFDVEEGANRVSIRVSDISNEHQVTYIVEIHKIRSSASIFKYTLTDFVNTIPSQIQMTPNFSASRFSYSARVKYEACALSANFTTTEKESTVKVGGKPVGSNVNHLLNLAVGRNVIDTLVVSENGQYSEIYSIAVHREDGTEEEIRRDARLQNIELSVEGLDYVCGVDKYIVPLNDEVNEVDMNLSPAVDGVTIYVNGKKIDASEGHRLKIDDDIEIIDVDVIALDGRSSHHYEMQFLQRDRNVVEVKSSRELQVALLNANPNDEIRVHPGIYQSAVERDLSDGGEAHFFSDRSGTVSEEIYLTSYGRPEDTLLIGNDNQSNAALTLSGKYWNISGLTFARAKHGLVLDNADNIAIKNIILSDIKEDSVVVKNGSTNNTISLSHFYESGKESPPNDTPSYAAIRVGLDEKGWHELPGDIGRLYENDESNVIRQNKFFSENHAKAIYIQEGARRTIIENNEFLEESEGDPSQKDAVITLQGDATIVRYNVFGKYILVDNAGSANKISAIKLSAVSEGWHEELWGNNTEIYQNFINSEYTDIPFVDADDELRVFAAENYFNDGTEVDYLGMGVHIAESNVPRFQIQLSRNPEKCLGVGLDENIDKDHALVTITECSNNLSAAWKLVAGDGMHVLIENMSKPFHFLSAVSKFRDGCSIGSGPPDNYVFLGEDNGGYTYRWRLDYDKGEVVIKNKTDSRYGG